jgi:hypothetical protein
MPELHGTLKLGADAAGGGLETPIDVVEVLKTIEEPTTQTTTNTKTATSLVTTGYTTTYDVGELKTLISPTGKNIIAPLNLKNLIKKNGALSSYVLPIHPDNKNIIYLSISNTTSTGKTLTSYLVTNKIFSYNLGTGASKILYEEQGKKLELHTVGIDGTRLIVLASVVDNSPGPCTDMWYDYTKDFSYLELQENLQGLYPYDVPAEKIAQGEASQKKCLRDMEQGANQ